MNQPICPLPFAPVSAKGVAEGPSLLPATEESTSKEFGDLLDSELEDESAGTKKPSESDPWTIFGHAQPVVQLLQWVVPIVEEGSGSTNSPETALVVENLPSATAQESAEEAPAEEVEPSNDQSQLPIESLLRVLKPTQQNLPVPKPSEAPQPEQIAANHPEPVKKANGIPVAQVPSMLFANQKEEETALGQKIALSEGGPDAGFEAEIQIRTNNLPRESAPKGDFDKVELAPINAVTPEWSSFEGIAEIADVQAPRDIESLEIAQAIRTHVELLKTSTQDKMDVVLRPDGQTELRLHVEKVNGQILVQARCDRGDFARLEANWSAVQQSLANQGVRVEALQNGATFQNESQHWNHSSNSSGQQFSSREESKPRFFEQEPQVPNRPKQSVASKGSARGWQSWA